MGVPYSTLSSYGILFVVVGSYAVYSFGKSRGRQAQIIAARPVRQRPDDSTPAHHKRDAKRKQVGRSDAVRQRSVVHQAVDVTNTSTAAPVAASASAKRPSAKTAKATAQPLEDTSDDNDRAGDVEFARQLTSAKKGTKIAKADDAKRPGHKSVKQSHAAELSAPSSSAGVDADAEDNQSQTTSPAAGAADAVADMLEAPAGGPSILRLTEPDKAAASAKPDEPKAKPQQAETKKKRQNRKKAEAAKAARDEDERLRKSHMEAQRRLARESEGRPAQDGTAFAAAQAAQKAWNGTVAGNSTFLPVQPLDDGQDKASQDTTAPVHPAGDDDGWKKTQMSEEEQLQQIREQESSWSTVKAKPRRNKKQRRDASVTTTSGESVNGSATAAAAATSTLPSDNSTSHGDLKPTAGNHTSGAKTNGRKALAGRSSFAALDDDDVPNEWDV